MWTLNEPLPGIYSMLERVDYIHIIHLLMKVLNMKLIDIYLNALYLSAIETDLVDSIIRSIGLRSAWRSD